MNFYEILLPLALILAVSKLFGLVCKKAGVPQVVGMLLAGLLIGLFQYIPKQNVLTLAALDGLNFIAKIGVILIMFSAGIETDLKLIKSTGKASLVITILGVLTPLVLGFLVAAAFNGGFSGMSGEKAITNVFYGIILMATSVTITVSTLKELGKLNSNVGSAIISAAVIDDVIGIIGLSLIIGLKNGSGEASTLLAVGKVLLFFVLAIGLGIGLRYLFKWMYSKYPHHRRLPIFAFAACFFYAYAAEKWFNVADITGAYIMGLVLADMDESYYTDRKIEVSSYMIFAPVFFANIGLMVNFSGLTLTSVWFGICFVLAGILGKFIGCGLGAKLCKYSFRDSAAVGIGMIVRAEVVLVCTQKGIDAGIITPTILPFVLILIVLTSLLAPILLKLLYKNDKNLPLSDGKLQQIDG